MVLVGKELKGQTVNLSSSIKSGKRSFLKLRGTVFNLLEWQVLFCNVLLRKTHALHTACMVTVSIQEDLAATYT